MNALGRFALYVMAVITVPWLALAIASASFECRGECDLLLVPLFGIGVIAFAAALLACVIVEVRVRRRSQR